MRKQSWVIAAWSAAAGCIAPSLASYADTAAASPDSLALEEIIVTAEYRSADLQKTGLAVSVIDGDALQQHGDTDLAHVLEDVPGVTMQGLSASPVGGSGGPPLIAIRGIGTDGPNKNSATAIYEDGVLVVGGGANFYDIDRVEVLRGPQGTLYGRGTTGGAVNIVTKDPAQTYEGAAQLTMGSYSLFGTQGMLNLPVTDDLSTRLTFNTIKQNGFFSTGSSDRGEQSARLKVSYKPNENFSLLLGGVYYKADQAAGGTVAVTADNPQPDDWIATSTTAGHDVISFREGYAKLNVNLGFANLTYIPAYQTTHSTQDNSDGSVSDMPYNTTFTQELRLSNQTSSGLLWTGGGYYFNSHFFQGYGIPGQFYFNQKYASSSVAAFGEVTYPLTSTLRLTGGVRESRDIVHHVNIASFSPQPDIFDQTYNHFDWKLRLEHDLSANSLLYGMVSTGYRPGGSVNGRGYDPEVVKAFEVGSKNRIGERFIVNAAAFYYDYGGFQSPESCCFPQVQTIVVSVPATFYGAELEGTALLSPQDKLTLSVNYLNARFSQNIAGVNDSGAAATTLTDSQNIPHSPKLSLSGSFQHTFKLPGGATIVPLVDAHYQSKQFTDFAPTTYPTFDTTYHDANPAYVQQGYTIANASLSFNSPNGNYSLTAYEHNITNVLYKTSVNDGPAGKTAIVNDPRTVGVIVAAKF